MIGDYDNLVHGFFLLAVLEILAIIAIVYGVVFKAIPWFIEFLKVNGVSFPG